jgi:hypothetical protein
MKWLQALALVLFASVAHGIDSQFDLLLDLDSNPDTGCEVTTPAGTFAGADAILTTFVATDGLDAANVTGIERRDCIDPDTNTFGAAQTISAGGWPVGIGNGQAGFNVIETFLPVSLASQFEDISLALVATDELGNSSVLMGTGAGSPIVLPGNPPIPVPLGAGWVLLVLSVMLLLVGLVVISRRGRLTLTALVCLAGGGVAGAACVLDGEIFNWDLSDLLAETDASDPENGVDIRALFGKRSNDGLQLCFRIDAALVFAAGPVAADDAYTTVETQVLNVAAGDGLLANDQLGLPEATLVSFGGGDLGGTVDDHGAGGTATFADGSLSVNADGSFEFQAESGFEGDFTFVYRISNPVGSSEANVTIEVQSGPQAVDDDFSTLAGELLEVAAPGVLANDSGLPDPQVTSFGGGDLGGTATDQAAGTTLSIAPDGDLTLNADGSLSFTPPTGLTGDFVFDYRIGNDAGQDQATITITVNDPPEITSGNSHTCQVGDPCAFTFTATGFPGPTIALTGTLPTGVSFNAATESLEGTPDTGSGAEYSLTISADNGIEPQATQTFVLAVNEAPTITSPSSLGCEVGASCDFTFTAAGFPDAEFDLPGLPAGLNLDPLTGVLSGSPDTGTGAIYNLTVTAMNGIAPDATQGFTLTIGQAPTLTSAASLTCEVGQACAFTFTADGFPDPTFDLPGLPTGLSLDEVTGELTGTPDAGTGAEYNLTLTAENGIAPDATQDFTLTINEVPEITSGNELTCQVGSVCEFTFTATGFPDPTFELPGLPMGLSLDEVTGELTGTPDAGTGTVHNLMVTAMNGIGADDTQAFTLTINEAPTITSGNALTCQVGSVCEFTFGATGFPDPTFELPGLPTGLSLDEVSGELTGTPAAGTGAVHNLILTAMNGVMPDATQGFTLTINEAPEITSDSSTTCILNEPCSFTFTADGFPAPTFTLSSLPDGLMLNNVTGQLSGTPTQDGVFNLNLTATNVAGSDNQSFELTIGSPPTITSANSFSCVVGSVCEFTFTADGIPDPTLDVTGTFPVGVTFNAGTDSLEGTPAAGTGAIYTLEVTADNGISPAASQTFTLTVNEAPMANNDPDGGIPGNSAPGSTAYHGAFNTTLNVSAADGVLTNDILGFPTAGIVTPSPTTTGGGNVTLNADGSFSYTPATGFTGIDTFVYEIQNAGGSDTATVEVAVGARPSASDASYPQTLIGNVGIDTSVQSGFTVAAGGDGLTLGVSGTTNGNATVNPNGTFTFNPAAGVTSANGLLEYSVSNGFGSDTGTITIPIGANRIWFADTAAGAGGDGRLGTPFNTLAAVASAADAAGDRIFLHSGSGDYTGGITLLDNQRLLGQAGSLTLATMADVTPPTDSVLPATGGTAPVIVNGSGNGVTLAAGNRIQGFAVGNTSGSGISGTGFGTLTVADVSISGTGQALNLTTGSIAGAGFSSVSSSSGGHNVLLTGIGGTLNLGTGSLSGASTSGFEVNGGTATINYGGSITTTGTARPVRVLNRTAGTVTLSGAISGTNGILLTDNTGSTIAFGGALNLTTGTNTAFEATGGGTITTSGAGSTLQTTNATALRVVNTTIGAANLSFQRIGSNGGSATGIVLNNTGSNGGLIVTGSGTAGSGGTIANKTGADDQTEQGVGIYLNQTANVSLSRMQLNDFSNYAILGQNVAGFELTHSVINGANGTNIGSETDDLNTAVDQGSVRFLGLTSEALVANSTISGGRKDNFWVQNSSGTLDRIVFDNVTMGLHSTGDGNNSLRLIARGTSVFNATVQNSSFLGARGDQLDFRAESSGDAELVFTGNTMINTHPSIATGGGGVTLIGGSASGLFDLTFENNTLRDAMGSAILLVKTIGPGNIVAMINDNMIGVPGTANSGSMEGSGISVRNEGGAEMSVAVVNNAVYQYNNFGITFQAGGGVDQSGVLNGNVIGNTIANPGNNANIGGFWRGLHLNSGVSSADAFQVCFDVSGNTMTDSGRNGGEDARLRQRQNSTVRLPGYLGGATNLDDVQAYLESRNVTPFTGAHQAVSTGFAGGAPCF